MALIVSTDNFNMSTLKLFFDQLIEKIEDLFKGVYIIERGNTSGEDDYTEDWSLCFVCQEEVCTIPNYQ